MNKQINFSLIILLFSANLFAQLPSKEGTEFSIWNVKIDEYNTNGDSLISETGWLDYFEPGYCSIDTVLIELEALDKLIHEFYILHTDPDTSILMESGDTVYSRSYFVSDMFRRRQWLELFTWDNQVYYLKFSHLQKINMRAVFAMFLKKEDLNKSDSLQNISSSNIKTPVMSSGEYFDLANEQYENEDYKAAYEAITKVIELSPLNIDALYFRGVLLVGHLNNYEEAKKDLKKVSDMAPEFPMAYYLMGDAFYQLEDYSVAVKEFSNCLEYDTSNVDAYFMRALSRTELGDRRGAIDDYDQILNRENNFETGVFLMATVYNNKGFCLVELEQYKEALPYLNKALEMSPEESYIWGSRGELYFKTGEYEKCIEDMTLSIKLYEQKVSIAKVIEPAAPYYYRGMALLKSGKTKKACKDLRKAGELGNEKAWELIRENCGK